MMSAMIANTSDIRPPAPRPWSARNAASSYIEFEIADSAEPARNSEIAVRYMGLRPRMSDSLPYSGVEIVDVMRYAVVTQAWTVWPCSWSAIVFVAEPMMV